VQHLWSTGAVAPELTVSVPGKYWFQIVDPCFGDTLTDSVAVGWLEKSYQTSVSDSFLCDQAAAVLKVSGTYSGIKWQDGSTEPLFSAKEAGSYFADVTKSPCTWREDFRVEECEKLEMPNWFSPNTDQQNDRFTPILYRGIAKADVRIFNRWGKLVFESGDLIQNPWSGKTSPDGVYFWTINYWVKSGNQFRKTGFLTLQRSD
jgi:gliding motility-associated-like protein